MQGEKENTSETKAIEFLLVDFEQQYAEYRQAETSRGQYVQYYVTLITAVIAIYGVFIQWKGFPIKDYTVASLFAVLFTAVAEVGRRLVDALVSTRIAQLATSEYIQKLREHFSKTEKTKVLKYAEIAISPKWYDVKLHAIRLILLILLVDTIAFSAAMYQWTHVLLMLLSPNFQTKLVFNIPISIGITISSIIFVLSLPTYYWYMKKKIESDIAKGEEKVKKAVEKVKKQIKNKES